MAFKQQIKLKLKILLHTNIYFCEETSKFITEKTKQRNSATWYLSLYEKTRSEETIYWPLAIRAGHAESIQRKTSLQGILAKEAILNNFKEQDLQFWFSYTCEWAYFYIKQPVFHVTELDCNVL